jgi:hypothetical protein
MSLSHMTIYLFSPVGPVAARNDITNARVYNLESCPIVLISTERFFCPRHMGHTRNAIVDYRLSLPTSVLCFCLQQTNGSLPFPLLPFFVCVYKDTFIFILYLYLYIYLYIYAIVSNTKRKSR